MHLVLGAALDLKNEPREAPGTLKNDAPVEAGAQILIFRGFSPQSSKKSQKGAPREAKMEPKSASGAPWEGEISLGNSPGAPPEVHHEFFFGSGGLRERFGSTPGGQKNDFMLRSLFFPPPGGSGERFWSHFGWILERFLKRF